MGSISGKRPSMDKTMEKAQDMARECPPPRLMKRVQDFKMTTLVIATLRRDLKGWLSSK